MKKENKNKFGGRELSEIVKCTLVGGNLLPRYSAVTGPVTENTLRRIRSDAGDKARFYGLAVGHWIDLPQGTRTPVPLAYGEGQVSFKRTLIDQCDEVFVLAPLGKLFAQTKEATRTAIAATGAPYAWVPIEAVNKVKLVTTRRSRGLLRPLSKQIQERYQQFAQSANPLPEAPLEKIGAILFDFDHREGISIKEQILLDFPHPYEWTREFLSTVFSVELEDWSVLQQITDEYNAQSKGD
jgi:hypothetical protein